MCPALAPSLNFKLLYAAAHWTSPSVCEAPQIACSLSGTLRLPPNHRAEPLTSRKRYPADRAETTACCLTPSTSGSWANPAGFFLELYPESNPFPQLFSWSKHRPLPGPLGGRPVSLLPGPATRSAQLPEGACRSGKQNGIPPVRSPPWLLIAKPNRNPSPHWDLKGPP